MRIVFLDRATFGPTVELLRPDLPHDWQVYDDTSPEEVVERLAGATGEVSS